MQRTRTKAAELGLKVCVARSEAMCIDRGTLLACLQPWDRHTHTHTCTHTYTHTHTCARTCTHTHTHTCSHTYAHTKHTHTHTHACTHTHTVEAL